MPRLCNDTKERHIRTTTRRRPKSNPKVMASAWAKVDIGGTFDPTIQCPALHNERGGAMTSAHCLYRSWVGACFAFCFFAALFSSGNAVAQMELSGFLSQSHRGAEHEIVVEYFSIRSLGTQSFEFSAIVVECGTVVMFYPTSQLSIALESGLNDRDHLFFLMKMLRQHSFRII
jgi:hypothetical protein